MCYNYNEERVYYMNTKEVELKTKLQTLNYEQLEKLLIQQVITNLNLKKEIIKLENGDLDD